MDLRPMREGVSGQDTISQNEVVPKYELVLKGVTQLSQLDDRFAFFTPAVLYLYEWIHDGMFVDFMRAYGEIKLHFIRFNRPIFRRLEARSNGDAGWNYALWAVERSRWEQLLNWFCSLMLVSSDRARVARIAETELTIVDPVTADASTIVHAKLPVIRISALGVDGSHEQRGINRNSSLVIEPPSMQTRLPSEAMKQYLSIIKENA